MGWGEGVRDEAVVPSSRSLSFSFGFFFRFVQRILAFVEKLGGGGG